MIKRRGSIAAFIWLFEMALLVSCSAGKSDRQQGRSVTDHSGRTVNIPDTVKKVIALKSGTMRLLAYMGVTDRVSHIEGSEQRRNVPYLVANPHLRGLPVIGAGNHHDTELLAAAATDLIVATFMSPQEADRLQRLTLKPVMLLNYGDLGVGRDDLFSTLTLLGEIFHLEERADTLKRYIEATIDECAARASRATEPSRTAYVGGVAYNGAHGLTSTETDYPPFMMLSVSNAAIVPDSRKNSDGPGHEVLFIEVEQLIEWNPEVIFLDAAGRHIWEEEIASGIMQTSLAALRTGEVYTVLPYNWNSTNFENLLCNVWYIGSVMMPSAFGDVDVAGKSREVYKLFYGTDIYDLVYDYYKPFSQLRNDNRE